MGLLWAPGLDMSFPGLPKQTSTNRVTQNSRHLFSPISGGGQSKLKAAAGLPALPGVSWGGSFLPLPGFGGCWQSPVCLGWWQCPSSLCLRHLTALPVCLAPPLLKLSLREARAVFLTPSEGTKPADAQILDASPLITLSLEQCLAHRRNMYLWNEQMTLTVNSLDNRKGFESWALQHNQSQSRCKSRLQWEHVPPLSRRGDWGSERRVDLPQVPQPTAGGTWTPAWSL